MKRMLITLAALGTALVAFAQPQLREDNIEQVLQAMTLQEKATLLVGGACAAMVNGVTFNEAASAWEAAAGKYNVPFGASVDDIPPSGSLPR